ncbi:MAG: acyltransferase family protein [Aquihabitans sp.]
MSVAQGEHGASTPSSDPAPTTTPVEAAAPRLPRVPALDGLRGLAVVAVLLFHGGYLTGGWLGVDLFFVLSGYLITSLLLVEHRTNGAIRLGSFWGRRARRLLPALLLMVVAVAIYAWFDVAAIDLGRVRSDGLATLFFVANWHDIIQGASYWDRGLAPSMFAHTWSLAVEEQLYLLWPLVVAFVLRRVTRRPARTIARVALLGAFLSGAIAIALRISGASLERIYLGTDTRAVAVLLGAFVAGWRRTTRRSDAEARRLELAAIVGAIALAVAWWGLDGEAAITYWGGLLVASALAALVVAAAADPRSTWLGGVLGIKPLRALGLISYGLYLWHWPVYVVLTEHRTGLDGLALLGVRLGVTLAIATASWALLERPIRERRPAGWWDGGRGRASALAGMGAATIVLLLATRGAVALPTGNLEDGVVRAKDPAAGLPKVLVLGDSVAASIAAPVIEDPDGFGVDAVRSTVLGCQAVWDGTHRARGIEGDISRPPACPAGVAQLVAEERPDAVVLLYGGWTNADFELDGEWVGACDAPYQAALRTRFTQAVEDAGTSEAPVFVVNAARSTNTLRQDDTDERTECTNDVMEEVAAGIDGVQVIDLDGWLCPKGTCKERLKGLLVRNDGVHFGGPGGTLVSQWLFEQVLKGAGLDAGAMATPRDQTPEYLATLRVCRSFAELTSVTQGRLEALVKSEAARDQLRQALDAFDQKTLDALPGDVAADLEGLDDPTFQTWVRGLLDRLSRGESVAYEKLPQTTLDGVDRGMARLREMC